MPQGKEFVNFHSARQADPDSFVRIKMLAELSNGIQIYGGPLKSDPEGGSKTQTYRFPAEKFTLEQARKWLKDHEAKTSNLLKATGEKKDSNFDTVMRFDRSRLPSARMTKEGYIRADAVVTRVGVFLYRNADGSERRELRLPDEVFNKDSLESMKMIPVTNTHPQGRFVDADNAKDLQIGTTGETITHDAKFVTSSIVINRKDGVEAVKRGRRELSLGYNAQVEFTDGIWEGQRYDAIQRNIRYNHLAIVDEARAGSSAALHLDEAEVNLTNFNRKGGNMPTMTINGIQYEAAQEVINDHAKLSRENADLKVNLDTSKTDLEKEKARADEAVAAKEKLEKKDNKKEIADAVKVRIGLERKAAKVLDEKELEKIDEMSDKDIKVAVISKKNDGFDAKDKSDDYIDARFDSVIESVKEDGDKKDNKSGTNNQKKQINDGSDGEEKIDQAESRKKMIERSRNAWQNKESEKKE